MNATYLPEAKRDWMNIRMLDFKSVDDYSKAVYRIKGRLELCDFSLSDDDLIEKTLTTMPHVNAPFIEQLRESFCLGQYKSFPDLLVRLTVAEQRSQVMLANGEERPP